MIRMIAPLAAALFAFSPAFAETPLTGDTVARFIETLEPVEAFGDRLEADKKLEKLFEQREPTPGKDFRPYSDGVAALKKASPAEYEKLGALLKPQGFSQADWASTGDRVMLAYMANRMEKENPGYEKQMAEMKAQMAAMDPAMLAQMPAQAKSGMLAAQAMVEAISKSPPADRAAVKPHMKAISEAIDD